MTKEQINLLTTRKYQLVMLKDSKTPFMDERRRVYLFDSQSGFLNVFGAQDELTLAPAIFYKSENINKIFYPLGFEGIKLYYGNQKTVIPIEPFICYSNKDIISSLILFKETRDNKYLRQMKNSKILVAVTCSFDKLHYIYMIDNGVRYYFGFSGISDFNKWNKLSEFKYSPLEISMKTFAKIVNNNGIIINPATVQLTMNNKMVRKVTKS